jgi:hypothetical protein
MPAPAFLRGPCSARFFACRSAMAPAKKRCCAWSGGSPSGLASTRGTSLCRMPEVDQQVVGGLLACSVGDVDPRVVRRSEVRPFVPRWRARDFGPCGWSARRATLGASSDDCRALASVGKTSATEEVHGGCNNNWVRHFSRGLRVLHEMVDSSRRNTHGAAGRTMSGAMRDEGALPAHGRNWPTALRDVADLPSGWRML